MQAAVQAKFNSFGNEGAAHKSEQESYHSPPSYGNNNAFSYGGNTQNFTNNFDSALGDDDEYEGYKIFK